jgi:hypothetical protein
MLGSVMPELSVLTLSRNRMSGTIPVEALAASHSLSILDLDGNAFDFEGEKDQLLDYLRSRLGRTAVIHL